MQSEYVLGGVSGAPGVLEPNDGVEGPFSGTD